MKLQILVPQYNETEDVITPLLKSLAIQQGIDLSEIGVIIVNDGSEVILNEEFLHSFPFSVEYIKAEHGGVSAARNRALEASTAEYVMFCDADDMFCSMLTTESGVIVQVDHNIISDYLPNWVVQGDKGTIYVK